MEAPAETTIDESITVIQGIEVYDQLARKMGAVTQIGVDRALSLVLLVRADDGTVSIIPWSRVKTIGHIILLGEEDAPAEAEPTAEADTPEQDSCPECAASNAPDSKFCEECGNDLSG